VPLVPGAGVMGMVWSDHAGLGARYWLLAAGLAVGLLSRCRAGWTPVVAVCCFVLVAAPLFGHWILETPASLIWRRDPWIEGWWANLSAAAGLAALMAVLMRQHGPPMALTVAALLVWLVVSEPGDGSILRHVAGAWHSRFGSGAVGPLLFEATILYMPLLLFGLALDHAGPRPGRRLWMPALLLAGLFGFIAPVPQALPSWPGGGWNFSWTAFGQEVMTLFNSMASPHAFASLGTFGLSLWLARHAGAAGRLGDILTILSVAIATVGFFPMIAWIGWRRSSAARTSGRLSYLAALFRHWFGPWLGLAVLIGLAAGPLRMGIALALEQMAGFGDGDGLGSGSSVSDSTAGLAVAIGLAAVAAIASAQGRMRMALCTALAAGLVGYATDGTSLQTSLAVATVGALAAGLARPDRRPRSRRLIGFGYALQRPTGILIAGLAAFGLAYGLGLRL